ncbi:MAG: hypothetical protein J6P72_02315 [Firmicutes bacterium]|nr:hypothetical protein [Bacillota bacterium]
MQREEFTMEIKLSSNTPLVPHKKHWQFCVGSGHALLALRTDYTRQLKFIHDTLGIERVRFHGIFDDDMRTFNDLSMQMPIPGAEAFTEYNFNACGVAYDNVLDAGMKPFVELSFMPEKLALKEEGRALNGMFFYKPIIVPPADLEAWKDYIQAFLKFLIHRYGIEEIRTWYFEVWNEPDLPVAFWNGSQAEYFALYETTARAIKEMDSQIKVGGPSTSGSKWVKAFVDYCRKNEIPVDFVSTHQYAGDPLGGVEDQGLAGEEKSVIPEAEMAAEAKKHAAGEAPKQDMAAGFQAQMMALAKKLGDIEDKTFLNGFRVFMPDKSELQDVPNNVFITNAPKVKNQADGLPVFYTEWNENATFSAFTNDTRKVAAYDVKTALDVADSVDGSSIWCFSDIFEELHPFPQEFHGGFGMLTQNGIPKPVYHAMKMLADAGDQRFDLGDEATKGEIGYAAFRGEGKTQIVLFRQKMKNLDLPKEDVSITFEMPNRPSSVVCRRVDEDHGNPLKLWQEMGSPLSLNRKEIEYLKSESAVLTENWPYTYQDGKVLLSASLGVNDVYMITLFD